MIPELLLEQILLGEKDERDYYKKYGKSEIQAALAELRASNEEILAKYPVEKANEEFIKRGFAVHNKVDNGSHKRVFVGARFIKYASAAVLLFVLAGPIVMNYKNTTKTGAAAPAVRVKGGEIHHQIRLYRQDGAEATLLKNGTTASENDLIQITYIPGEYKYGVIFSVDGNGSVTRHFPEDSWKAGALERTGDEVPLSFAYALDDAPKYECFIFVASKSVFDLSKIEKINKDKFSIDFLKKGSYLPKDCDGSIFVLNKE